MKSLIIKLLKGVSLVAIGALIATFAPALLPNEPHVAKLQMPTEIVAANEEAAKAEGPKAPSIRVISAESREIAEYVTATGTIEAREEALVGADVAGLKVEELYFDVGDVVKTGDRLARLDSSNTQLQLVQIEAQMAQVAANKAQAEAQVVNAEVSVKQAKEALDRVEPLLERGVATRAQRDTAQNGYDSAIATLNSAKQSVLVVDSQRAVLNAQTKQAQLQLDKTDVIAPFDGIILSRSATIGQVVSGSAGPLFRIARDGAFELAARVAEDQLPRLKSGLDANIMLAGHDKAVKGSLRLVRPEVDQNSRLGTVDIALPIDNTIKSGSFAEANIEIARRTGVVIPITSVMYRDRTPYVQLVVDGRVESREITLGLKDGTGVEVLNGLNADDEIVSRAGTFVADGDLITPVRSDDITAAVN